MITKLTEEQRQALHVANDTGPVSLVDPETNTAYVLLRADIYDRVKPLFDEEPFDIRETYAAQEQVASTAGWDDPEMDVYNDDDAHRPKP